MTNTKHPKLELEVLVATQNRSTLDFLLKMFPFGFDGFKVLVINQSVSSVSLTSELENVRVINSNTKGLSVSRNIALENCDSDIALIADDDLIYPENFQHQIIETFQSKKAYALITFKAQKLSGGDYRTYSKESKAHTKASIKDVISWEIAFRPKWAKTHKIVFNERFGLGAEFQTAEEYLFANSILEAGGKLWFENKVIVSHPDFNSGMDLGSDRVVYARAALNYKLYKSWAYVWLMKYVVFLINHDYIAWQQGLKKYNVGVNGIAAFKKKISA
ncbi:MAG: hypothetical protein BM564_00640 [Bacteroidetes bacterium MedPE-SWsnd-G2]|mgnify:CR=1 FL=1|nr:MAG: hypothetical protein BM564_00640 [Bacteroidetes bacterium MedPE-SWsnd-G2]